MIYLPKDVEEYIIRYCTEYNITRKDKEGNLLPSLGTGVVTYLKSAISGESPNDILAKPSRVANNGLTKGEVLDLIQEYATNLRVGDGLSEAPSLGLNKSEVLDLINESITSQLLSTRLSDGLSKSDVLDLINESSTSQLPSDIPNDDWRYSSKGHLFIQQN